MAREERALIIGERLKALRGVRSQHEVAEALCISDSALSAYEQGDRIPRDEIKIKIAAFYGVSEQSLFFDFECHDT